MISQTTNLKSTRSAARWTAPSSIELTWSERAALFVGLVEIPLQIDKYIFFQEEDALLGAVGGLSVSITTICLVFLYGRWIATAAADRISRPATTLFGLPMLAYLGVAALSAMAARKPLLSFFDVAIVAHGYALFFYIANRINTRRDVMFCIFVLCCSLLIQSLLIFGLVVLGSGAEGQSFTIGPLLLAIGEDGRPAGPMHSPVLAGSVLAMLWMPVMACATVPPNRRLNVLLVLTTAAGLLAILLTQTRGAILTVAVGSLIVVLGIMIRGRLSKRIVAWMALAGVLSAIPLVHVMEKRVMQGDEGSAESRIHLSAIAAELIADRPLLGHGAGNCHLAGQLYADSARFRSEWYFTIHCKYLLVWVETGLFGFIAFLAVLGNGLRQGIQTWRYGDRVMSTLGLGLAAAIAGHMVHLFVDVFNSRTQVQTLWTILAMAAVVYKLGVLTNSRTTLGVARGRERVFRCTPWPARQTGSLRRQDHGGLRRPIKSESAVPRGPSHVC